MTIAAARLPGAPDRRSPPLGVDSVSAGYLSSALLLAVLLLTLGI